MSRVLQWVVPAVLLIFLGHTLATIGLARVWAARPASPVFYLLLVIPFFIPPYTELLIYRSLWPVGKRLRYFVLLRKQALNSVVLEYSGEAYFFLWCQRHLRQPTAMLLHAIKDSNLLSAGAGFANLCLAVTTLVAVGGLDTAGFIRASSWTLLPIVFVPLVLCLALFIGGRRLTTLTRRQMSFTFALHLSRALIVLAISVMIWFFSGALKSPVVCLEFVALRLLITRVPLLPSKELVFASAAIVVARFLEQPQPQVAAVLVLGALFEQILAIGVTAIPWLADGAPSEDELRPDDMGGPRVELRMPQQSSRQVSADILHD